MIHELFVIWLPTVASAVAVFIVSSVIHMATKWHANDTMRLPNEDAVANLLRDNLEDDSCGVSGIPQNPFVPDRKRKIIVSRLAK